MISIELPDGHVGIRDGSLKNDDSMDKTCLLWGTRAVMKIKDL